MCTWTIPVSWSEGICTYLEVTEDHCQRWSQQYNWTRYIVCTVDPNNNSPSVIRQEKSHISASHADKKYKVRYKCNECEKGFATKY
jgi:hypothetical protein